MRSSISIILLAVFFVFVYFMELDQDMAGLLNERVKNAVNRATHDASLCIDKEVWADGKMVFHRQEALVTFNTTLAANLGLNPVDLNPKPNTMFTEKPVIELVEFIDDNSGVTYPYFYENPTYGIGKIIYGPSVISVVKIKKPLFCSLSAKFDYRKWAVYEYPIPR